MAVLFQLICLCMLYSKCIFEINFTMNPILYRTFEVVQVNSYFSIIFKCVNINTSDVCGLLLHWMHVMIFF